MKNFENIKALLLKKKFGVLATIGLEYPYTSLVAFTANEDLREIYFATDKNTSKYNNIIRNPKVSFLIYDLGKKSIKDGKSLTALGQVFEIKDYKNSEELTSYIRRHPELENFVNNPDCSFMKISVYKYIFVDNFQRVEEHIC
jgi:nitroimidazol reductase NimA-like FMN-containing flavoprotein (pyridoxamine 5'-phosphate oxidase superfamily)